MIYRFSSLTHMYSSASLFENICLLYHISGIFFLLISFYFKTINKWSLHGKNLFITIEEDERGHTYKFYTLIKKIDDIIISKAYFSHFYIVGLIVNSFLLFQDFIEYSKNERNGFYYISLTNVTLQIHLIRRLLEQLFVVRTTSKSFMHIISYFLGISFYVVTPFSLRHNDRIKYSLLTLFSLTLFVCGNLMQCDSHVRLARLRPQGGKKSDILYKIPYGGLFYFISCPHYFSEILIYFSFLTLNLNFMSSLNFTMVFLILIKNGIQTHKWYLKTLPSAYPNKNMYLKVKYI
ncbi:polyprenol reductase, putative [Plasmodium malariae]|uniref:Polyprenol reductase, putative n=1 Tax=Plasmodium malariae TaxID=5858 RepID=A0A1C3L1H3_PLAMA|nr:polyprenol reductase, putative [Plasmodium malariae]